MELLWRNKDDIRSLFSHKHGKFECYIQMKVMNRQVIYVWSSKGGVSWRYKFKSPQHIDGTR